RRRDEDPVALQGGRVLAARVGGADARRTRTGGVVGPRGDAAARGARDDAGASIRHQCGRDLSRHRVQGSDARASAATRLVAELWAQQRGRTVMRAIAILLAIAVSPASADPYRLRADALASTQSPAGLLVLDADAKASASTNAEA